MIWGKVAGQGGKLQWRGCHSGKIRLMTKEGNKLRKDACGEVLVVLCTCPDPGIAERLAGGLVEHNLAACVNILPQIRSIYRWQGELNNDSEALMVVKTTRAAYPGLQLWLQENHPYDVPEVLALPLEAGSPDYLAWVIEETATV